VAGRKERQRRLARERYLRQQARRAERARRWRLTAVVAGACAAVLAVGAGSYFLFFSGGGKSASAASASATPSATPSASASATPSPIAEPAKHCAYTASGTAARKVGTPPARTDYKAHYQATIKTNRGNVVIDLLNQKATCTVNSFVYLASKSYFSDTKCHRLTTSGIYVLQCGDPTGTGSGGPGYKFADENLTGAKYTAGTLAMANSGPGTNGSQFFLVYKDSTLSPNYTPFGKVVSGLGIIKNVAEAGSDNANGQGDGHPKKKVIISGVTIKKT
jgi:peptidyl-prolyl cis-trans isomerase B (cyclophilin B)